MIADEKPLNMVFLDNCQGCSHHVFQHKFGRKEERKELKFEMVSSRDMFKYAKGSREEGENIKICALKALLFGRFNVLMVHLRF